MDPALASSMSKGSVTFVESPIAASPNERGGRKEISEKLGKGALSELRFCSVAVLQSCGEANSGMVEKIF